MTNKYKYSLISLSLSIVLSYFLYNLSNSSADANKANAGCLIVNKYNQILMSRSTKTGKLHIPGGTNIKGESPEQTAKRESIEELGVDVDVHKLYKKYDNGFYLYKCTIKEINHKHSFEDEISGNEWIDVLKKQDQELRFPEEYKNIQLDVINLDKNNLYSVYDENN